MGIILRDIPAGRAGDGLIPEMIGQADFIKAMLFGHGQQIFCCLRWIAGAAGKLRMNMKIMICPIAHENTTDLSFYLLYSSFGNLSMR